MSALLYAHAPLVLWIMIYGMKKKTSASRNRLLYLSRSEVSSIAVPMSEIVAAVQMVFEEKGKGRTEMPPKPGIHPLEDAFIHAMPAFVPAINAAGMKWIAGYPQNAEAGLPYINGLVILNDPETGIPICVMDGCWITAKRTGAATAVAASYLARQESEVLGVLGCGVQGRSNLEALKTLFPISRCRAYDVDPSAASAYAKEMGELHKIPVEPVDDPRQAVSGCDIVVTAGPILKTPHATIEQGWLDPGGFASLVDFDSYWSSQALREADKIGIDDFQQFEHYRSIGYFGGMPSAYASLDEVVCGKKPARQGKDERTLACNLGLALEDMAVARLIYNRAREKDAGTWLDL